MQQYKKDFLDFIIKTNVIRFGEFKLKSGRISPYFFNSGLFNSGASLSELGKYYADTIINSGIEFDMLFGPAYKGIPLVSTISIALAEKYKKDIPYSFNRKEAKKHGENGIIVGAPISGKVLIVDDVVSSGISVAEASDIIKEQGGTPAGVLIALDRAEIGNGTMSATEEITEKFDISVTSIINLKNLISYLQQKPEMSNTLLKMQKYQDKYGVNKE